MKSLLKTITVLACAFCMTIGQSNAQAFKEGQNALQLGIGFPNLLAVSTSAYSGLSNFSSSTTPPIHLGFERAVTDNISAGLYLGYTAQKFSYAEPSFFGSTSYNWTESNSWIIVGARGNYHFATGEKLDPYVGVILGYNIVSSKVTSDDPLMSSMTVSGATSQMLFGGQIGMNYYFSDSFGAHVEVGYGVALVNLGITLKM